MKLIILHGDMRDAVAEPMEGAFQYHGRISPNYKFDRPYMCRVPFDVPKCFAARSWGALEATDRIIKRTPSPAES